MDISPQARRIAFHASKLTMERSSPYGGKSLDVSLPILGCSGTKEFGSPKNSFRLSKMMSKEVSPALDRSASRQRTSLFTIKEKPFRDSTMRNVNQASKLLDEISENESRASIGGTAKPIWLGNSDFAKVAHKFTKHVPQRN